MPNDLYKFLFADSQESQRFDAAIEGIFEAAEEAARLTVVATTLDKALKGIKYSGKYEEFDRGDGSVDLIFADQAEYDAAWLAFTNNIDKLACAGWVPVNLGELDHSAEDAAKFGLRLIDVGESEVDVSEIDVSQDLDKIISAAADVTFSGKEPKGKKVNEAYQGQDIVGWQGRIERQLAGFIVDAERDSNFGYADKLREFQRIWRDNELTGSVNTETVQVLLSATEVLAVDTWRLASYFSGLRDALRKLLASNEELPVGPDDEEYQSMRQAVSDVAPVATFGAQKRRPAPPVDELGGMSSPDLEGALPPA